MFYIVGLGNPGEEYARHRHNVGQLALTHVWSKGEFSEWKADKVLCADVAKGVLAEEKTWLLFPTSFMNKSGLSLKPLVTSPKKAEKTIVLYDDIDLPLGSFKIAFNRGSGGHKGIESIEKQIKTKAFVRVRIGICPTTPAGTLKKPSGEAAVKDFLLGDFKKKELEALDRVFPEVVRAVEAIISEGRVRAMNQYN